MNVKIKKILLAVAIMLSSTVIMAELSITGKILPSHLVKSSWLIFICLVCLYRQMST